MNNMLSKDRPATATWHVQSLFAVVQPQQALVSTRQRATIIVTLCWQCTSPWVMPPQSHGTEHSRYNHTQLLVYNASHCRRLIFSMLKNKHAKTRLYYDSCFLLANQTEMPSVEVTPITFWHLTLTFNPKRATVMTHTHEKDYGLWSKVTQFKTGWKQTGEQKDRASHYAWSVMTCCSRLHTEQNRLHACSLCVMWAPMLQQASNADNGSQDGQLLNEWANNLSLQ